MDIFTQHKDKIFNLSYKITGNKAIAEDIVQEAFLRFYENIETFRGDCNVSTWLYTVAKNCCLQFLRKEKRISRVDLTNLLIIARTDDEIPNKLEKNNYINQVKEGCLLGLLRTLSFNQRFAFIMHVLHQHSIEFVSKTLQKTESATRTLIHRARKNLKEFLCANCSLYQLQNKCKCEGMIGFSLKNGWIKYDDSYGFDLPKLIESELDEIRKIEKLYLSLPNHKTPNNLLETLKKQGFFVFSDKKVK